MYRRLKALDWPLMAAIGFAAFCGLLVLASLNRELFERQIAWFVIAAGIVALAAVLDWRWLLSTGWFGHLIYWSAIALLVLSHFQTATVRGTKSWITFGWLTVEPVEFAKIGLIFVLAGFFSKKRTEAWLFKNLALSFLYLLIPTALVILQPDLGSAVVLCVIWFVFLATSGVHWKRMAALFSGLLLLAVFGWFFILKPYQKDRIISFVAPERDPLGANYNVIQSKVAIGSAGLWGKGFGLGSQSHLGFLPEPASDFIFTSFVEEWGIAGGFALLLTFLFIIFRMTAIGLKAGGNTLKFTALGVGAVLLAHLAINVGSAVGLTPVTGITLPFVSYGGSSLLTLAVLVSIIQRIKIESGF